MIPQNQVLTVSVLLTANITQGRFVQADGSLPAVGERALGVAYMGGKSGDYIPVTTLGVVNATAGSAIAIGDAVNVLSTGKVQKHGSSRTIVGVALTSASSDGDEISVHLIPN